MTSRRFMDGIGEVIEDARWLAQSQGRKAITFEDIERAVTELRSPSDALLRRAPAIEEAPKRKRPGKGFAMPFPSPGNHVAMPARHASPAPDNFAALDEAALKEGTASSLERQTAHELVTG